MDIINEYYFPIIVHTYCRLKLIKRCGKFSVKNLKVVSAIYLLVWFLNKGTCETREKVFYFTSKVFLGLEKIKF